MSWQLLTAISVITLSVSILLQRLLLHKDKSDPIAYVVMFQGLVGVLVFIYALTQGFELPDIAKLWFPMFLTICLYGVGHIVYAKSLQITEASVFSILFATNAFWLMLIGVFVFNENINAQQILGAILIFTSVVILVEKKDKLRLDRGTLLGLLTGLLFGLAGAGWAYVGRSADAASWTALSFIGPSLLVLMTHPSAAQKLKPFFEKDTLTRLAVLGVLFSISAVTLLTAYQNGNLSLIAPLQQTSIIFTILLAIIFLKEKGRLLHKTIAALICFIGVLLIV